MNYSLRLPIYEGYEPSPAVVQQAEPLDRDALDPVGKTGRACGRCVLSSRPGLKSPCITAEGRPGGLLVVGEAPGKDEDAQGRPFIGASGALLRGTIAKHWKGPVAYDNALRCFPARDVELKEKLLDACRGFLTKTIDEVKPVRILAVGAVAAQSLFGRSVPPLSSRGAYGWLRGSRPVPVFFVVHPAAALRNRFVKRWFLEDMERALTTEEPDTGPWEAELTVVANEKLALLAEKRLLAQEWAAFDVETSGRMWNPEFKIISTSLCGAEDDDAWLWPEEAMHDPARLKVLLRILTNKKFAKVGQNVKYDQLAFRSKYGIKVEPIVIDTRLQRKLIDPEAMAKLSNMAELVGMGGLKEEAEDEMKAIVSRIKRAFSAKESTKADPHNRETKIKALNLAPHIEQAIRAGEDVERFMYELLPKDTLHRYNARDAVATKRLALFMEPEIAKEPNLQRIWSVQVRPASVALERVEGWGVAASLEAIRAFDRYLEGREVAAKAQLDQYDPSLAQDSRERLGGEEAEAKAPINWNSDPQVRTLLFDTLKLKPNPQLLTDTGKPSVSKEALADLHERTGHPLPKALMDYSWVTHLRGTYAQGLISHVRADGRIHPNIKLDGARSGRTSCTDPNLQNIPRAQTVEGKMARDCFVASPGCVLLEADYSQLELRVAAMLSGDPMMKQIFRSGVDYHLRTAQLVSKIAWNLEPEQVGDAERSLAKNVNFGVAYGKTAGTFAKEWGVSRAKAQSIVDAIMGNFKGYQKWCEEREAEALTTGYVWTWWDGQPARRRSLFRIADADDKSASVARNGSRNTPIQGTASDFLIASLVQCVQWIEDDGIEDDVKLILAVHDSIMFEVRESWLDEVAQTVQEIMLSHNSLDVPLQADFKAGRGWGSMKKYTPGKGYAEEKK